jgi:hypothetical protein
MLFFNHITPNLPKMEIFHTVEDTGRVPENPGLFITFSDVDEMMTFIKFVTRQLERAGNSPLIDSLSSPMISSKPTGGEPHEVKKLLQMAAAFSKHQKLLADIVSKE